MFANIYLNEQDKYLKHILKCKYVSRYMDDTIIILRNKEEAKSVLNNITCFLNDNLKLKLNSKTNIFKISQGVNYCGYKINKYGLKIRNRGKRKIKIKIKKLNKLLKTGKISVKSAKNMLAGNIGYAKIANINKILG